MSRRRTPTELNDALEGMKPTFLMLLFFSCMIDMLMLAPAIYMPQVYDHVLVDKSITTLLVLALLIVGLYIVIAMVESTRVQVMVRPSNRLNIELNRLVFNTALKRKMVTGDNNPAQSLAELDRVRQSPSESSLLALLDIPWTSIHLFIAFLVHSLPGYPSPDGIALLFILTLISEISAKRPIQQAYALTINNTSELNRQLQSADVIEAMRMPPILKSD